jgi:hypothetical protein
MMTDPLGYNPEVVEGVDWSNDDLFFTHVWSDETSQFDDHPTKKWNYGGECYERQFKARVPVAIKDSETLIELWLQMMIDNYPDAAGFWAVERAEERAEQTATDDLAPCNNQQMFDQRPTF